MVTSMFVVALLAGLAPHGAKQAASTQYSCGPFLLKPGPRTMTVVVDHERPIVCELSLKKSGQRRPTVIRHKDAKRHHIFSLENLTPGTLYQYEIRTGKAHSSGKRSFRTLPLAPKKYKIIAMGDSRTQPQIWRKVAEQVRVMEKDALFMLGTGDYPFDGRQYRLWVDQFFTPGRELLASKPLWPAIGNHESTRTLDGELAIPESHYFSLFELPGNERWYRVDYQYLTLLYLDSNTHFKPGSEQYEWLYQELRSVRNRFTVLVFHHATYSSGLHSGKDSLGKPVEWPIDEGRRFLAPLFEMYGVDLVLNGHDHLYERSEKNGVVYVVTGGAGAPLYAINAHENPYQKKAVSTHHYLRIDVTAKQLNLTAIELGGAEIDRKVIPVSTQNLARRRFLLRAKLDASLRVAKLTDKGRLSLVLDNPLDHRVELLGSLLSSSAPIKVSLIVKPFASGKKDFDLGKLLKGARARSSVPVYVGLQVRVKGQDQAMPIDMSIVRKILLRRVLHVVKKGKAPRLDAKLNDWQKKVPLAITQTSPISFGQLAYTGNADCRADLRLRWSDVALHVAVDVIDDLFVEGGGPFNSDSVHLYFATAPAKTATATAPTVTTFVSSFYADGRASMIPVAALAKIRFITKKTSKGYRLEASIPFSVLPLAGKAKVGAELLFGCLLVDLDDAE